MNNILYVYIDESVDFGFSEGISILYVVSFVFYVVNLITSQSYFCFL